MDGGTFVSQNIRFILFVFRWPGCAVNWNGVTPYFW